LIKVATSVVKPVPFRKSAGLGDASHGARRKCFRVKPALRKVTFASAMGLRSSGLAIFRRYSAGRAGSERRGWLGVAELLSTLRNERREPPPNPTRLN
jgi:hypothetical protein